MADEYILRSIAIAKLTALEVTDPFATIADAKRVLADMAAADVAKVVRCKDCANATQGRDNEYRCIFNDAAVYAAEHYCAFGEKTCGQDSNDG